MDYFCHCCDTINTDCVCLLIDFYSLDFLSRLKTSYSFFPHTSPAFGTFIESVVIKLVIKLLFNNNLFSLMSSEWEFSFLQFLSGFEFPV